MLARKISTPFASVINQRAYQRRVRKGVSRFFIKGVIIYPYTHFDVYTFLKTPSRLEWSRFSMHQRILQASTRHIQYFPAFYYFYCCSIIGGIKMSLGLI